MRQIRATARCPSLLRCARNNGGEASGEGVSSEVRLGGHVGAEAGGEVDRAAEAGSARIADQDDGNAAVAKLGAQAGGPAGIGGIAARWSLEQHRGGTGDHGQHIVRRLRQGNADPGEKVVRAAGEFTRPLAGSSLSTIVIHIPPAFLVGVTGAFFAALSLTMASALVISFAVAWLAVPILATLWLGPKDAAQEESGPVGRRTTRARPCGSAPSCR